LDGVGVAGLTLGGGECCSSSSSAHPWKLKGICVCQDIHGKRTNMGSP
jgi:hypothetical protein